MTATDDLIKAALAAAELFREGDTPDQAEIRVLVRAADDYRPGVPHTVDGCLICAVRAMTEGEPNKWAPTAAGQQVSGVILKAGQINSPFSDWVPFVDLWTGQERVRVAGFASTLAQALKLAEPAVGDRLTAVYDGQAYVSKGPRAGQPYKRFTVTIERGHH